MPILLTLSVVIATCLLGGRIAKLAHQPAVIGELLAGIALGPAVLGSLAPGVHADLFGAATGPVVSALSQLGVAVLMFGVGLELRVTRSSGPAVAAVTAGSLLLPLSLGALSGLSLQQHRGHVAPWVFVLFVAGALSVTACPVLALILKDRGIDRTPLAATAMSAAAGSDALVWVLLAIVSSASTGAGAPAHALAALVVAALTAVVLRVALTRLLRSARVPRPHPTVLISAVLAAVAAAAAATDRAGIHAVMGPLLLGVAMPRARGLSDDVESYLGHVARAGLLPFFFLSAGAPVLGLLDVPLRMTGMLLLVAVLGKVVGAAVPARLTGSSSTDAGRLGILLSTRGLTELVFLSAGLELGVIDRPLYTALVAVALCTTTATAPLLDLVERASRSTPVQEPRVPVRTHR